MQAAADETDHKLTFGPVEILWPKAHEFPIALYHRRLGRKLWLVTVCLITYRNITTNDQKTIPAHFIFDGASIPFLFWCVPGFAPFGKHIWAALLHDWLCEEAAEGRFDRVLADAIFAALLEHTGVDERRALVMELAVDAYRFYTRWRRQQESSDIAA